ncbi:MAG TPA: K(+)-transporting ATPase subunit C [Candidatus Paceibacterota bacterium]|nr:K(+)-transporting ATPase subunit C [Candidatus Paceibacterota bacterium]
MKEFLKQIRISVVATLVFAVILCGIYPLAVWVFGQALFPWQANGSLITDASGTVIGSALIGQNFSGPQYFEPRPSAAGAGYDPTASGGTNLGPTSQKLATMIQQNIAAYREENDLSSSTPVPADAVTASASGLDPEISMANAAIQAPRVAKARNIPLSDVESLVEANTVGRGWGVFGEPGVNVLTLNLALDAQYPVRK